MTQPLSRLFVQRRLIEFVGFQKVSLEARDKAKAGIFTSDDGITRYPKAFIDKMLKKYKTPRKVDDGPDIPV